MQRILVNPLYGVGFGDSDGLESGAVRSDPAAAQALFGRCPAAHVTPLVQSPGLATQFGVDALCLKDERARMGLGSFKALGAAYAIAKLASERTHDGPGKDIQSALTGITFICASAGNHGLSMAAAARLFGAKAVVYVAETVPHAFAVQLRAKGAVVVRHGDNYETSMDGARAAARQNQWQLLSDSSWLGYRDAALDVMEGYLITGAEVAQQIAEPPSHIFLQAGVGGLAASCAAIARRCWGNGPKICVVEPEYAPAIIDSIIAEKPVHAAGPVSDMGRLDCKEPSHLALRFLAIEANYFMTISEDEARMAAEILGNIGIATTPSGAAGFAGFAYSTGAPLDLYGQSRVLVYVTEGLPGA